MAEPVAVPLQFSLRQGNGKNLRHLTSEVTLKYTLKENLGNPKGTVAFGGRTRTPGGRVGKLYAAEVRRVG